MKKTLQLLIFMFVFSSVFGQETQLNDPKLSFGVFYSHDFYYNHTDAVQSNLGFKTGLTGNYYFNKNTYVGLAFGIQKLGYQSKLMDSLFYKDASVASYAAPYLNYSKCTNCDYEYKYDMAVVPIFIGYSFTRKKMSYNIELGSILEYTKRRNLTVNFSDDSYTGSENVKYTEALLAGNISVSYLIFPNTSLSLGTGLRMEFNSSNIFDAYSMNFNVNHIIKKA